MSTAPKRLPARDRILDTACELFYAHGIHAVGVDRLIAESGVAKATLYKQFPSKDDVVAAYLRRMDDRWRRQLRSAASAAGDDPRDQLFGLFVAMEHAARGGTLGCAFINAVAEYEPGSTAHTITVEHKRAVRDWVRDLAAAAGAAEPDMLAFQLTLLIDGTLAATRVERADAAAEAAKRTARDLLDAACPR
ncbi:TetR/AcrR family transcriptional regulator [Streptomyces doebereineriae]|uniref:TetR/AcrR family transcriptional regulator n=1 Tax=Streptomyces doebereineriae TaxID=3075528 RepID=A0ABU2V8P9_9ACTN|nr:TetR/AcrR family transcriptional regulator [Streptomyces sp. DSM 41640]MDT0481943.1 TetR/AcrR family transcriptional regulator [Streptomyces sp. DSM 41640]